MITTATLELPRHSKGVASPLDSFWTFVTSEVYCSENHGNHNFSCFKNGSKSCRFCLPRQQMNSTSRLFQLELVKKVGLTPHSICLFHQVQAGTPPVTLWQPDNRCIISQTTLRSADDVELRDRCKPIYNVNYVFVPNWDSGYQNGNLSPSNFVFGVYGNGGSPLHNNIQIVQKGGMGENSYIVKYVTKGNGSLNHVLPMLYEAINMAKRYPSVHPDVETNPLRPYIRTLQRTLNNELKVSEYGIKMIVLNLMGLKQFASTHRFCYLDVTPLQL